MSDSHDDLVGRQKEFVDSFFKKGAEFAEELLRENEKLRFRVVQLEEQLSVTKDIPTPGTLKELVDKIHRLEREREHLLTRFTNAEAENREYLSRFREIERENNNLASLYVTANQLHSTFDLREVLQIIVEIVLNFVGAKTFAIYLVDDEDRLLHPVAAEGIAREDLASRPSDSGALGAAAARGEAHYGQPPRGGVDPRSAEPAILVPLRTKDRTVGVIAVWELLLQKSELLEVDYELFQLLGAHAAAALEAARMAAEAGDRPRARFSRLAGLT